MRAAGPHNTARFEQVEKNLGSALKAAGRWAYAYDGAEDPIRAQITEAVFEKTYIDNDGNVTSKLRPLFAELLRRSKKKRKSETYLTSPTIPFLISPYLQTRSALQTSTLLFNRVGV